MAIKRKKIAKEKCQVFRIGNENPKYQYTLGSSFLLTSDRVVRDLGVMLSNADWRADFSFTHHFVKIVKSASTAANYILRAFSSKYLDLYVKGFVAYVRPLLEYASAIWSPYYKMDML